VGDNQFLIGKNGVRIFQLVFIGFKDGGIFGSVSVIMLGNFTQSFTFLNSMTMVNRTVCQGDIGTYINGVFTTNFFDFYVLWLAERRRFVVEFFS